MPAPYRAMGERFHAIIKAHAPVLSPRLWYGMPAYAKDGKVVCFFRGADKFKERYMTLGFNLAKPYVNMVLSEEGRRLIHETALVALVRLVRTRPPRFW